MTPDDFAKRLNALNDYYEAQLQHILRRGYNRQRLHIRSGSTFSTLFWRAWPLIESYELKPFSFSKLIRDFPSLAQQLYLAQLLSHLRRRGLLRKVGSVRMEGHNLPEVVMAQTPIEEYTRPKVDKLAVRWSIKLEQFKCTYRPTRPNRSIRSLRKNLVQNLFDEGYSPFEIERVFSSKRNRPR